MSLDWNTKECPGNGETAGHIMAAQGTTNIHPATNSLVWGAFCGFHVGQITTKNIDEIAWRIEYLRLIDRPWMSDKQFPSLKELDDHLGLHTNCDTKTRKQWLAFVTACLSDDVTRIRAKFDTFDERVYSVDT